MECAETIADLRSLVGERRAAGSRIGFVPTMGALHEGHLSLVDAARRSTDIVVLSVFVNPLQFGPNEDLARYPRDVDGDAGQAAARGVDIFFAPPVSEMYPGPVEIRLVSDDIASRWEGAARPDHFGGVLTVVAKLFHVVAPDVAIFGRKDLQQTALIRRMVRDLDFPVEVVVAPTVREPDGLALSSRNQFLRPEDRERALSLVRALRLASEQFNRGDHDALAFALLGRATVEASGASLDYFAIVDPDTMAGVTVATPDSAAIVAARVGTTRLIDNMILGEPE